MAQVCAPVTVEPGQAQETVLPGAQITPPEELSPASPVAASDPPFDPPLEPQEESVSTTKATRPADTRLREDR
jgi:hypothetical protein